MGASKSLLTRRECLPLLAYAAAFPSLRTAATQTSNRPMRGAFMILSTPYNRQGEVDWEDLAREAAFVDRCGCQGMVWPQGSSGLANLTKEERMRGMDVLAKTMKGKTAVLGLGVQGKDTVEMLQYAAHAEQLGPDAMIAMPPSSATSVSQYREYFRALASVTNRPVILQTNGGGRDLPLPVELIIELAGEFPHLAYIKEESTPILERMRTELLHRPPIRGIFGANFAQGWLYEMRLGLDGVITGNAMYADLMGRIWSLHEAGKHEEVRDVYSKFLLMRNLSQQIPGADLYIMKKRNIFKTTANRTGHELQLTAADTEEIEYRFAALRSYLSVDPAY